MKTATGIMVLPMLLLAAMPVAGEGYPGGRTALLRSAERLEASAYDVLNEAVEDRRYFNRGRESGLDVLRDLAWVASYFHEQVRVDANPYRTAADFEILAEAFYRAEWWMNRAPVDRRVHKEFRKLSITFGQVGHHYDRALTGYARTGAYRMDEGRYHEVMRMRVMPRVTRYPAHTRPSARLYLDVGLRIPGGTVRVVWR